MEKIALQRGSGKGRGGGRNGMLGAMFLVSKGRVSGGCQIIVSARGAGTVTIVTEVG